MKKLYVPIAVIILLAGAIYFILQRNSTSNVSSESVMEEDSVSENMITYSDSGFSPNTITVEQGTTVTFLNQSSGQMWVASSVHPTHQDYPGFDQLKGVGTGEKYTFIFDKVGTWKYHNHLSSSNIGTVVVQ